MASTCLGVGTSAIWLWSCAFAKEIMTLPPQFHPPMSIHITLNDNAEASVVSTLPSVVGINFGNCLASIAVFTKDWQRVLLMKMVNAG